MLLTITTTFQPATDLGFLLHKHPARVQEVELPFGKAHVFYPEASAERCTAALLLDVDPVGLVRGRGDIEDDEALADALGRFMSERADVILVATSKARAEQLLKRNPVDAAIVDLALPDGSGLDLLNLLWKRAPLPQVLVISGAATPDTAFNLARAGVRGFLSKPVDLEGLGAVPN